MDAIYKRRSERRYSDIPVSDEDLNTLIAAGMMAPSAGNQQPWHFITITDPTQLTAVAGVNPNAQMVVKAPAAILVCGDRELEMHPGYWVQDCSAALQNILLAAHDMGLGAVWTGIWTRDERVAGFKRLFHLPDHIEPLGLVVLGHLPDNRKPQEVPDRFRADRIHRECW